VHVRVYLYIYILCEIGVQKPCDNDEPIIVVDIRCIAAHPDFSTVSGKHDKIVRKIAAAVESRTRLRWKTALVYEYYRSLRLLQCTCIMHTYSAAGMHDASYAINSFISGPTDVVNIYYCPPRRLEYSIKRHRSSGGARGGRGARYLDCVNWGRDIAKTLLSCVVSLRW